MKQIQFGNTYLKEQTYSTGTVLEVANKKKNDRNTGTVLEIATVILL